MHSYQNTLAMKARIRELEEALAKVGENIDDWHDTPPIREAIDDFGLLFDYEVLMEMITTALSEKSDKEKCGNACGFVEPYGFVPEAGCPIHCPEDEEDGGE